MAHDLYLYTDSSGTAHAVQDIKQVPKKYRSRVSVVAAAAEPAKPAFSMDKLRGPLLEQALPLVALLIAWRRFQGFFIRATLVAALAFWGYLKVFSRLAGMDTLKTDPALQQLKIPPPVQDEDAPEPPLSSVDETGVSHRPGE